MNGFLWLLIKSHLMRLEQSGQCDLGQQPHTSTHGLATQLLVHRPITELLADSSNQSVFMIFKNQSLFYTPGEQHYE
ncbi:unnamed protein product [Hymenolepis diminuta]|uniref:Uncharacterized protein n=1 Tax=Hymenolepis diminuta TaxID=6216 RepID=A0A564Y4W0_HYMDI|nr:unnamed protein product [Hymenolepis diminuta]